MKKIIKNQYTGIAALIIIVVLTSIGVYYDAHHSGAITGARNQIVAQNIYGESTSTPK